MTPGTESLEDQHRGLGRLRPIPAVAAQLLGLLSKQNAQLRWDRGSDSCRSRPARGTDADRQLRYLRVCLADQQYSDVTSLGLGNGHSGAGGRPLASTRATPSRLARLLGACWMSWGHQHRKSRAVQRDWARGLVGRDGCCWPPGLPTH